MKIDLMPLIVRIIYKIIIYNLNQNIVINMTIMKSSNILKNYSKLIKIIDYRQ